METMTKNIPASALTRRLRQSPDDMAWSASIADAATLAAHRRPRTRAECPPPDEMGRRECPWLSCRHHLAVDVDDRGRIVPWAPDADVRRPGRPDTIPAGLADDERAEQARVLHALDELLARHGTHCSLDLADAVERSGPRLLDFGEVDLEQIGQALGIGEWAAQVAYRSAMAKLRAGLLALWLVDELGPVLEYDPASRPALERALAARLAELGPRPAPAEVVAWLESCELVAELHGNDQELWDRIGRACASA